MNAKLANAPAADLAGKYLKIGMAGEAYGIPILKVREIIRMQKITPMPQRADSVKGVINLRGRIIPVVDLRVQFGLSAELADRTCIVVVQVQAPSGQVLHTGLIVDAVDEVVSFRNEQIESTPEFGVAAGTVDLLGMAKSADGVITLLDIDRVIHPEDLVLPPA